MSDGDDGNGKGVHYCSRGGQGREVVVKEIIDRSFVRIVGKNVKERRINVLHLEPTSRRGEIPTPEVKEKRVKLKEETKTPARKDTKIVAKILEKAKAETKVQ